MIEVELLGVQAQHEGKIHLMLLRELTDVGRVLMVVIDMPEARSIYHAMEGIEAPRPQTHDLMKTLIADMGASVAQVCITDLRDRTFYATLELQQGSKTHTISARPSDAIALAARFETPIFVSEHVLDEAGQVLDLEASVREGEGQQDVDPRELIDEFKSFLDSVKPGDFQSPEAPDDTEETSGS